MRLITVVVICAAASIIAFGQRGPRRGDRREWERAQVADALRAAPPPVTENARIFAWNQKERVLVRDGSGPYTCVASGSWSTRLGKPPLPFPDPFCADQNAWAYIQAMWNEPDPLHPSRSIPRAPGLVWMLAGMNVVNGRVSYGQHSVQAGTSNGETITMTPHVMILPLPVDPDVGGLPVAYDPSHPLAMWVMGAGTPTAHLHVHFSPQAHQALKRLPAANH